MEILGPGPQLFPDVRHTALGSMRSNLATVAIVTAQAVIRTRPIITSPRCPLFPASGEMECPRYSGSTPLSHAGA